MYRLVAVQDDMGAVEVPDEEHIEKDLNDVVNHTNEEVL